MEKRSRRRLAVLSAMLALLPIRSMAQEDAAPHPPARSLTLAEMLALPEEQLAEVDIAAMNLAVAEGLPGSEKIDRELLLRKLDFWAEYVAYETGRHRYRFEADPADYNYSWGYFCMLFLTNTLQQAFGVRYNPDQITPMDDPMGFDFTRSQDLFINGLINGTGGTCPSMPVLYIAVGRRLGYPLKLVTCPSHSYLRWDDPKTGERFNIEGTVPGFLIQSDTEYASNPRPAKAEPMEQGNFYESLSPREELSVFLTTRGDCLYSSGRIFDAYKCYEKAAELAPRNPAAKYLLQGTAKVIARMQEPARVEAFFEQHQKRLQSDPRVRIPGLPVHPLHGGPRQSRRAQLGLPENPPLPFGPTPYDPLTGSVNPHPFNGLARPINPQQRAAEIIRGARRRFDDGPREVPIIEQLNGLGPAYSDPYRRMGLPENSP